MRYKFRGKTTKAYSGLGLGKGDWIYGSLIDDIKQTSLVYISWWKVGVDRAIVTEVIRRTVAQSTGLKDKNGIEIYEGDIVELTTFDCNGFDILYKGVIGYFNATYVVMVKADQEYLYPLTEIETVSAVEIIGNIHDNPELIK